MACEIRKRNCMDQQQDRISELPDEILGQILSSPSIPIQDVVKTSCFSKRWKTVWIHVDTLQIRDRRYSPDSTDLSKFANFVTRAFDRVSNLRKLEMDCNHAYANQQWIDIVTSKLHAHVSSLIELDLALYCPVKVPPCVFTSKNLRILKLSVEQLQLPSSMLSTPVCLPCLKVLHLKSRTDVSLVENILLGCPVLEQLRLSATDMRYKFNKKRLLVKSSSIKRLKISIGGNMGSRIEVDACNLEDLDLYFDELSQIFIVDHSLLSLTRLVFRKSRRDIQDYNIHVYGNRLIELLTKAPNVEYLSLPSDAMLCLHSGKIYQQLPVFKNLVNLKLEVYDRSWPIVHWFLERWHCLASFSIRGDNSGRDKMNLLQVHATPPRCPMKTRLGHLENVEFENFQGLHHEMKLARYIRNRAPVLKTMTLTPMTPTSKADGVVKLPKASTRCKVINKFIGPRSLF